MYRRLLGPAGLCTRAQAVHRRFAKDVCTLAEKTSGKALVPPLKGKGRAKMKALFKYLEPETGCVAWFRLTDLVRATLEYADIDGMYKGLDEVIGHFGGAVKEFNDRYQRPLAGGYRDLQLVVRFEEHMCELQLSTASMTLAKKTTGHRDF